MGHLEKVKNEKAYTAVGSGMSAFTWDRGFLSG